MHAPLQNPINIFSAAEDHNLLAVQQFIRNGGDISIRDNQNRSLLQLSLLTDISCGDSGEDLPHFLLDSGISLQGLASIDDILKKGSVLHLAYINNYRSIFFRLLEMNRININEGAHDSTSSDGCFASVMPTKGREHDERIIWRRLRESHYLEKATVLHYACLAGDYDAVRKICSTDGVNIQASANIVLNKHLIDNGSFVDADSITTEDGDIVASTRNKLEEYDGAEGFDFLGWGWTARQGVQVVRVRGVTPLHLAARAGHFRVVEFILGIKPRMSDMPDGDNKTPLDYANTGLEEFTFNYEIALRGELSEEPASDSAPRALLVEIRAERESDIARDIANIVKGNGNPEKKIDEFKRIIAYIKGLISRQNPAADLATHINQLAINHQDEDFQLELIRMLFVESRYFGFNRNRHPTTHQLMQRFFSNRYGSDRGTVDITDIPMRRLIAADAASVQRSIELSGGERCLMSGRDISSNLRWPHSPSRPPYDDEESYSWQRLLHAAAQIMYTHKPVPGHLGGFFMPIAPKQNDYRAIITMIDSFTGRDPYRERFLARCMIIFSNTGRPMPIQALTQMGISLTNEKYELLIKICYLTSVKEITRRMFTGLRSNGSRVMELPFATIHVRALKLIRDGHLTMEQVFSQDADYGIATGSSITAANLPRTLEKVKNINMLYNAKILQNSHRFSLFSLQNQTTTGAQQRSMLRMASTQELRRELQEGFGGEADSDGEGYEEEHFATSVPRKK